MNDWALLLGLMLTLLGIKMLDGILPTLLKILLVMGAVGTVLNLGSFSTLKGWATGINTEIGATAIASSLVFIGINFAIQQSDIPFLSNKFEMLLRYILYVVGGVLMAGADQWNKLFVDFVGIWNGKGDGILGILKGLLEIVTLGLGGS